MSEFCRKCGQLGEVHTVKSCRCVCFKTVFLSNETKLEGMPLSVRVTDSGWILGIKLKLRQNDSP